jgi:flagellar biosynthesis protein FlhA
MPMADAAANYTILTVGDGLVGQIPALIISTGAGIMVTRTASGENFGTEVKRQFSIHPRALWVVSGILGAFALIPGLPQIPFILMALMVGGIAWRVQKTQEESAVLEVQEQKALPAGPVEENYEAMLTVDLLEMEVGYGLIPLVDAGQNGELLPRIKSIRKQFALDMGFIVPPVHIKDNLQLKPNEYAIILKGVKVGGGELLPEHFLAMNPGTATETLKGIETTEPAFGLPAIWIGADKKERAQIAGYTVVDNVTVIATHISELIRRHAHELLGRQEAQNLLDHLGQEYPKLVEELVPSLLSLGVVMRVLQNLLRERVSVRDLRTILETLADWAPTVHDADQLTEQVRQVLARSISNQFSLDGHRLEVMTLDRNVENRLQDALHVGDQGAYLAIDPGFAQNLISSLKKTADAFPGGNPVLLCTPAIRIHIRRLVERYLPSLAILSHNEIAPHLTVRSVGTVTVDAR